MGRNKKTPNSTITVDLTALSGHSEATRCSVSDVLRHGTVGEIRGEVAAMAAMIEFDPARLNPTHKSYLVDALRKIGSGVDANKAFGLNRGKHSKRLSTNAVKSYIFLAGELQKQNVSLDDVWSFLSRLDLGSGEVKATSADGDQGSALRKQVERAHKKMIEKK